MVHEQELKALLYGGKNIDCGEYSQKYRKNIEKTFYYLCKRLSSQRTNKDISSPRLNDFVIQELNFHNLNIEKNSINPVHWFSAEWTKFENGNQSFFIAEFCAILERTRIKGIYFYRIQEPYFQMTKNILKPADKSVAADSEELYAPRYKQHTISRIIRNSQLSQAMKQSQNHICQICYTKLSLPDSSAYAEAHHLQPLSQGGPDIEANMICVCPNCHALLDFGAIKIDKNKSRQLQIQGVSKEYIAYHNQIFREKFGHLTEQISAMNLPIDFWEQMEIESEVGRIE